ncbi:26S proteasome regulatory complex, ATPase RPT4 [Pseudoloma neurophilia]|uniref:26S proteasome regulatory complex, ATPase RPT4 n=1 Tax=Pseudoloma neurophilia TaxID=146866 RepID=A0A0R0M0Z6_9MICR|nr:26S proteasome regulatory complex, ATPase RPT4 [Pseudoloma neurophilia]
MTKSIDQLTPEQFRCFSNLNDAIQENEKYLNLLNDYRTKLKSLEAEYKRSELFNKTVATVGQMVGEIITKIDDEKFIVKTSQGPRYVVGAKKSLNREEMLTGVRVSLDITTMTIMKLLKREIDPTIYAMSEENPGDVSFASIGGLSDQVRQLKEIITLPLDTPEIFTRVGIKEPKGVLLYGPPGTGKTLLARAIAATMDVTFLKVVASSLIEKYIGESSRMIREMFAYAREKTPCIIFLDEIDAIGGKRSSESSSSDREVQRTLMELLNQLDGFHSLDRVKVIMATNRPDILDPALLRPGRLDRKIEIPLPNEKGRMEIFNIYTRKMNQKKNMSSHETSQNEVTNSSKDNTDNKEKTSDGGSLDLDMLVSLSNGLNGADIRQVCTEAGMTAIREERDYVTQDDFVKAVRKVMYSKRIETKLEYKKV